MENNILTIHHEKENNLGTGEQLNTIYMRVYTTIFTKGLVAKMGATGFTTLMALATFMDEKGECYPTQRQLADRIGVHVNTVNKYVNDLLEVQIGGKNLVTRQKLNSGKGKIYSYYTIHPLTQIAIFGGDIEEVDPQFKDTTVSDLQDTTNCDKTITKLTKAKSIKDTDSNSLNSSSAIKLFQEIYREVYSVNYTVSNYGREGKIMKDKVITPYPDMAREIIELAVREYDSRFKNAKFPRPTISMFSWAANSIIPLIEEQKAITAIADNSSELEEAAEKAMLAKMERLG